MRVLRRGGKLLSVAMLAASLGVGLLNGGIAGAEPVPYSLSVNPNPIALASTPGLGANFALQVVGADAGVTASFTDTLGTKCTETVNGTAIATATVTTDVSGRAQATVGLTACSASAPGNYTITASSTVGTTPATTTTANYALLSPRP